MVTKLLLTFLIINALPIFAFRINNNAIQNFFDELDQANSPASTSNPSQPISTAKNTPFSKFLPASKTKLNYDETKKSKSSVLSPSSTCTPPCKATKFCDSGKCSSCSEHCLSCTSATSCTVCELGYTFLNDINTGANTCLACPENCAYCFETNGKTRCLQCLTGFIDTSSGQCEPCNVEHCILCERTLGGCIVCEEGYALDTTVSPPTCIKYCGDCGFCEVIDTSTLCRACNPGSLLNPLFRCYNIPSGCKNYVFDYTVQPFCIECKRGYIFDSSGNCVKCPSECGSCKYDLTGKVVCTSCGKGYATSTSGKCTACPSGCESCSVKKQSTHKKCKKCFIGYEFENDQCERCETNLSNCLKANKCKCEKCDLGYCLLRNGECEKCASNCSQDKKCENDSADNKNYNIEIQ